MAFRCINSSSLLFELSNFAFSYLKDSTHICILFLFLCEKCFVSSTNLAAGTEAVAKPAVAVEPPAVALRPPVAAAAPPVAFCFD